MTYAELDVRSNQIAHHLRSFGVGPGTTVGVALERSVEVPAVLLAVLKTGAAYRCRSIRRSRASGWHSSCVMRRL